MRTATARCSGTPGFLLLVWVYFAAGVAWIYVALHDYGGMALWLALLATLLFAAFPGSFYGAGRLCASAFCRSRDGCRAILVMPALWVLTEWLRGTIFSGFPWLTLGYAHSNSPLAGYTPLLGAYGVSLAAAISAGLPGVWLAKNLKYFRSVRVALLILVVVVVRRRIAAHRRVDAAARRTVQCRFAAGNIAQDLKFNEDALVGTLETYRRHGVGE